MTAISADDLLIATNAENRADREAAITRLLEDAYKRGWDDHEKAGGLDQMRWEHRLEEAEAGLA